MSWASKIALIVLALFMLSSMLLGCVLSVELPTRLLLGWISYLLRVVPHVRLSGWPIATFVLLLPTAAILAHHFCSWLWAGLGHTAIWRWKWTMLGLTMLLLMFTAGIAATGIVHQTGWLITSSKPLLRSTSHVGMQIKCQSNLRQMFAALTMYREANPGFRPEAIGDLSECVHSQLDSPDVFVCPASDIDRIAGTQPHVWRAAMSDLSRIPSYVVAPPATVGPDGSRFVLLHDSSLDNHDDGLNILYEDGESSWCDKAEAEKWLLKAYPPTE